MISRRGLLGAGAGLLAAPAFGQDLQTLKSLAAAKGFVFGSATATWHLRDADFIPVLLREAALIVPDYEMKRGTVEAERGHYDFAALDSLWRFGARNGLMMRGHPLVWYAANPPWLADALASRDARIMTDHIHTILRRYPMVSVDVVNEAIAPDADGLRPSPWLRAFGPGYIDMAFHAALEADPRPLRVYNDWGFEQGAAQNDRFRAATLKFLDGLLARKVPVQALGVQGHLAAFGPHVDQRKLRDFLAEISARGLAVLVTELDVEDSGGPSDIAVRDRAVADEARRFLDVVLDNKATRTVITWDLSDRYLDPPDDWKLRLSGWKGRKLPYDTQMKRKPLWDAMARSFRGRRIDY